MQLTVPGRPIWSRLPEPGSMLPSGSVPVCLMKTSYLSPCLVLFASVPKETIPVYLSHAIFGFVMFLLSLVFPRLKSLVCEVESHADATLGHRSFLPCCHLFHFWCGLSERSWGCWRHWTLAFGAQAAARWCFLSPGSLLSVGTAVVGLSPAAARSPSVVLVWAHLLVLQPLAPWGPSAVCCG